MWLWLLHSCVAPPDGSTVRAERGDLSVSIELDGELEARRTVDIVNPLEGWSELDFVTEAGSRVEKGDVVLRFKIEEVEKELTEARSTRDVAQTRVEQAEARLALQLGEARAEIVQAELDAQMAAFRQTDSETVPRVERAEARIAAQQALLTTSEADTKLSMVENEARSAIEVLQLEVVNAERKIHTLEDVIARSEVLAPSPGVVLVLKRWGRETFRAGHDVYQGSTVLQIPDLSDLDVKAWVHEVDAPKVAAGQRGTVTLDADEGTVIEATVEEVAPVVVPRGEKGVKQLGIGLLLAETTDQMKPGMTVSVELTVGEVVDGVLLPADALFSGDDGAFVRTIGGEEVPVLVVATDDDLVAVEGLEEGVEVVMHPDAAEASP